MKRLMSNALFGAALCCSLPALAELSCQVTTSAWNNGYVANVTVTNIGTTATTDWQVALTFTQSPAVSQGWSATLSADGNYLFASNVDWNASLAPGQSTSFGFLGAHNGNFTAPTCAEMLPADGSLLGYLRRGLTEHLDFRENYYAYGASSSTSSSGSPSGSSSSSASSSTGSSTGSSSGGGTGGDDITNTQELGVDEADIIEYDGDNLYVVQDQRTYVYLPGTSSSSTSSTSSTGSSSSSGGGYYEYTVSLASYSADKTNGVVTPLGNLSIPFSSGQYSYGYTPAGSYLWQTTSEKTLAIIGEDVEPTPYTYSYNYGGYPYYQYASKVSIFLADVTDPTAMDATDKISFDGHLVSSRRIDNTLFVVSRYSPSMKRLGIESSQYAIDDNRALIANASLADLLPHRYDDNGGSAPLFSESDCVGAQWPEQSDLYRGSLVVLTKIDLDDPSQVSSSCLPASASDVYASGDAVYAFNYGATGTTIYKFATAGSMPYIGQISVPGSIPCTPQAYCFGEQGGVLRVLYRTSSTGGYATAYRLSTIAESTNGMGLQILATLPNAARPESIGKPNEQIYSMRSFGDTVYLVTFQKVDPLYAVDISNPADPYIAGELEVSGFSDYLHPIGDGLLLGVGKDAYYEASTGMTWYQGVKIELFDISNPLELRSLGSEVIGRRGSGSGPSADPRAFAFRNDEYGMRFALPIRVNDILPSYGDPSQPNQTYRWHYTGLFVYDILTDANGDASLSRRGILKSASIDATPTTTYDYTRLSYHRGVLLDGSVFYLHDTDISAALLDDLPLE
ncbi:beta-propeller domain-containing protein [Teredinibacter turnerae]|uniref:beta-propeller domain-containing protein n=1 Tax=Teredinibacter turnerae TaxID=2426 RepID=UPI000371A35F|nr:beta-propeller domain-containing protein [Teredinibacter turnerae]